MAPKQGSGLGAFSLADVIFRPALAVLNRLRYAPKFVLVGAVLLVPFAFTAYLQYAGASASEEFSRKEVQGVTYISKLNDFLVSVQRRRILTVGVLSGENRYRQALSETAAAADAAVAAVDKVDAELGEGLKTSARWADIKGRWVQVRDASHGSATAADTAYAGLVAMVTSLIVNDAGNNSNLILEPHSRPRPRLVLAHGRLRHQIGPLLRTDRCHRHTRRGCNLAPWYRR